MAKCKAEYLLLLDGMDKADLADCCQFALRLVEEDMHTAETDIPWCDHTSWPAEAEASAIRLRDRFVPPEKQSGYMQTGVQSVRDMDVRRDFIAIAPYALDATFWSHGEGALASLSDEGTSFVILLTEGQAEVLREYVGYEHVASTAEFGKGLFSMWHRWWSRLGLHRG